MSAPQAAPRPRDLGSDATKGLLIALVALGHCIPAQQVSPWLAQGGLYDFHVVAFLLLPFLRPPVVPSIRAFADRAVRYLVPFVAFALLAGVAWHVTAPDKANWADLPLTLLRGDVWSLAGGVGFTFLWFMPCLLSLTILRSLVAAAPRGVRVVLVVLLIVLHGCLLGANLRQPLNPLPALYVLPLGWAVAWLAPRPHSRYVWLTVACTCAAIAAIWHHHINVASLTVPSWRSPHWLAFHDLYAIAATLAVVHLGPQLARVPGLVPIGRYSLVVYLSHQFVLKGVELWAVRQPWYGTSIGKMAVVLVAVPVSLAAGWWLARFLDGSSLRPWILPQSVRDWPVTVRLARTAPRV